MNIKITNDSRKVDKGSIYVAIKGQKLNGEDFIPQAIEGGATEIVVEEGYNLPEDTPSNVVFIKTENTRIYLAHKVAEEYDNIPDVIVGVTGTNGKTSVASIYKQIVSLLGKVSASIGTLGVETNADVNLEEVEILTSPDPITLHKTLDILAREGEVTHAAIEASSHGLAQHRVDGVKFKASAFTNLSPEHLDYHANMKEYLLSKARLFSELTMETSVLNADIPEYELLKSLSEEKGLKVISYGLSGNDIKLIKRDGDTLTLEVDGVEHEFEFHPVGDFQNYNFMASLGLAMATGFSVEAVKSISGKIVAAPGRLELVTTFSGAKVYVDYAHTPDALEKALLSLRKNCEGNLHVIFGAGGDRDAIKRPLMGAIAAANSDFQYITDDNPRTEDPAKIREEIFASCPNAVKVEERTEAIKTAMQSLKKGDVLLIAGKGHEDYQVIGTEKIHFSDKEEVLKIVKEGDS